MWEIDDILNRDPHIGIFFPSFNFFSFQYSFIKNCKGDIFTDKEINIVDNNNISLHTKSQTLLPANYLKEPNTAMEKYLLNDKVTKAEILWCLQNIMNHSSFRSAASSAFIFPTMLPESIIASKFKMQRTKLAYSIVYGIAPYIAQCLQNVINSCDRRVVGFDECLNKIAQRQQMDVHVWFWNEEKQEVSCMYLTSVFLGHTKAVDLLNGLKEALTLENVKKTIQLSMDGPNVNLKLHSDLLELIKELESRKLLELGPCRLYTVSESLKSGIKKVDWIVPARRANYINYTKCKVFPSKFCSTRLIKNALVAERAESILPQLAA